MKDAIVAIEDQRFYQHGGVDLQGILRALFIDLKAGKVEEGASTITQQLVGSLYLDRTDTSFTRKFREAMLAWQLESQMSKDEILDLYLNTVYFGSNAYGVEAAARTYFDKEPIGADPARGGAPGRPAPGTQRLLAPHQPGSGEGPPAGSAQGDVHQRLHRHEPVRRGDRDRHRPRQVVAVRQGAGAVRGRLHPPAADQHVRRRRGLQGRPDRPDQHQPRLPAASPRRPSHPRSNEKGDPVGGAGRGRSPDRVDPGDGRRHRLRQDQVQPGRPGPQTAGVGVQDLRPGRRRGEGCRPADHVLRARRRSASPCRARPNHGRSPPTAAHTRDRSTWSRPRCTATTPCMRNWRSTSGRSPSSTSPIAWASRAPSTRTRPSSWAGSRTVSRRSRWLRLTAPWPTRATTSPPRSS